MRVVARSLASFTLAATLVTSGALAQTAPAPKEAKTAASPTSSLGSSSATSARSAAAASRRSRACAASRCVYYFGATGGGVWKTTDGGATGRTVSDGFRTGSVGAIAVAESDPNVIYVGHGRGPIRGNVSHGDGVYKSTDAGETWTHVGLADTRQIARIRIHPKNPDIVYVAALGHVWGPNAERGVFRSEDGGKTWEKVLFVDDKTGASTSSMDPTNPRILYAAFWQVVSQAVGARERRPGRRPLQVHRRRRHLEEARPNGPAGGHRRQGRRLGLAGAARPRLGDGRGRGRRRLPLRRRRRDWTLVNDAARDPRSAPGTTRASTPTRRTPTSSTSPTSSSSSRSTAARRSPTSSAATATTTTSGSTPDDPQRDDQSATTAAPTSRSTAARRWSTQDNQPTAQFYRVVTDNAVPVLASTARSRTTRRSPSRAACASGGIAPTDWHAVGGGESGWIAADPRNPNIVYAGSYGGIDHALRPPHGRGARRLRPGRRSRRQRGARPEVPLPVERADPALAARPGHRSTRVAVSCIAADDGGQTWEAISPDLTRNDKTKQGYSPAGRSPTTTPASSLRHDLLRRRIAARSRRDLGGHRRRARAPDARRRQDVGERHAARACPSGSGSTPSRSRRTTRPTAYVAATSYKLDDFRPYLYKTNDYGKTWTKIVNGIPDGRVHARGARGSRSPRAALRRHRDGLYVSFDDGAQLAAVPAQPAGRADHRPDGQATRTWSWRRRAARSGSSTT